MEVRTPDEQRSSAACRLAVPGGRMPAPPPHLFFFPPLFSPTERRRKAEARRPIKDSMEGRVWMRCPLSSSKSYVVNHNLSGAIMSTLSRAERAEARERYYLCFRLVAQT